MMNLPALNYLKSESNLALIKNKLRFKLHGYIMKDSSRLFLKGRDMISVAPQVTGVWEPTITSLISHFSVNGYSDFFLDIGANIGLTSCQNGNSFKQVHMFEPNRYCCNILEVNTVIALNHTQYKIHKYGLGEESKTSTLTVPKHNWGGAFIKDGANSYSDDILAKKDGFEALSDSNYYNVEIEVRKASEVLREVFNDLVKSNLMNGVIKIDVEGYEPAILKGIAESIPDKLKVMIIFESFNAAFDMNEMLSLFKNRASAYKLVRHMPWGKNWPSLFKCIYALFGAKITNQLVTNNNNVWNGDIVLHVN